MTPVSFVQDMSQRPTFKPSPEQQQVLDTWDKGLAVLAGAGSGKTTTLVQKCGAFLERNPEGKFAAVSFTEKSAADLREKLIGELNLVGPMLGHWMTTIHGLSASIIAEFPTEAGLDGEEIVASESEARGMWEESIQRLWLEDIPREITSALELLLDRESRDSIESLVSRYSQLESFGFENSQLEESNREQIALGLVSQYVIRHYKRIKTRRGYLDFDDLEQGALRALDHERVRDHYRKRFGLVLIDEFQDTNPTQAKIIRKFCRPDFSNLIVVGDPKQSIYRFRDADVSLFEEFCETLPFQINLTRNYRSRAPIIEFVNEACGGLFEASSLRFDELVPQREKSDFESVVRVEFGEPEELADWILGEVEKGVSLDSMALLLRKIRGNEQLFKTLSKRGVPISIGSGGLFWDDPRVREVFSFLKWWSDPHNELSGATFMRAPWVGVADLEIERALSRPDRLQEFWQSGHPMAKRLSSLREKSLRPGEVLSELFECPGVEKNLGSQVLGLWHRCEELSSQGKDFHQVISSLNQAFEKSEREREVPPPMGQGRLNVLTLHGSKGLEFEHVLLIDFAGKARASNTPLLFWDRRRGVYLGKRKDDGTRDTRDPTEKSWRSEESKKNLAESKRLFYVALTRAKERLVLCVPQIEDYTLPLDPYAVDDWRSWILQKESLMPLAQPHAVDAGNLDFGFESKTPDVAKTRDPLESSDVHESEPSFREVRYKRPRHSVTEWAMLNLCPRQYEWKYIRPKYVQEDSTFHSELGTRVHAALENLNVNALEEIEKEVGSEQFNASPVIEWLESSELMKPESVELGRKVYNELAFEVPIGGEVLVGAIDRIVKTEVDGKHRIEVIDFKVVQKSKGPKRLASTYQVQVDLYSWAATHLLGCEPESMKVILVEISPKGVSQVEVKPRIDTPRNVQDWAKESAAIVNGREADANRVTIAGFVVFSLIAIDPPLLVKSSKH